MNLVAYVREVKFAVFASSDWRGRMSLLALTCGFHLNNLLRFWKPTSQPVKLALRIGDNRRVIWLRPFSGDIFILFEILALETYRISERALASDTVKTIVDCGANIGLTALYFAAKYPSAKIICVEPDPGNFQILLKNTEGEPRIAAIEAAIVGTHGESVFLSQNRPTWGNQIVAEGGPVGAVAVRGITLAGLIEEQVLESIDILKVDIEGGEEAMFRTPDFLSRVKLVAIELHHPYSLEQFRQDIAPMGFAARLPDTRAGLRILTATPDAQMGI